MRYCFFSPHFIDDTLNTRAECVRDSLICRKYMFLAKIFALRSMGIQLVPSPLYYITYKKIFTHMLRGGNAKLFPSMSFICLPCRLVPASAIETPEYRLQSAAIFA